MTTDGGLRQVFQTRLSHFHWQSVETFSTGRGVPDLNYCCEGSEGWIENKFAPGYVVTFQPGQIAWIERRLRAGGRAFIAVRRKHNRGPRKGPAVDELWLFDGSEVRWLAETGLKAAEPLITCAGGPKAWDWEAIQKYLLA